MRSTMSKELSARNLDELITHGSQSILERRYIIEFLYEKGYQLADLKSFPFYEGKRLMIEACRYASLNLAEVEARAQFRDEIRRPFSA